MNSNETANIIQILQKLGWTGEQINDLLLGIEGRVAIDTTADNIEQKEKNKPKE